MTTKAVVILSEQSESKDLGTNLSASVIIMRRFLDFARNDMSFRYSF